jgi:hypothetical protein
MKAWIDSASYEALLNKWRNAPIGSPWFQGEVGEYYSQVMAARQQTTPETLRVQASKNIGWNG